MPCSRSLLASTANCNFSSEDDHTKQMKEVFSSFEFCNFLQNRGLSDILASSDSFAPFRSAESTQLSKVFDSAELSSLRSADVQSLLSDSPTKRRRTSLSHEVRAGQEARDESPLDNTISLPNKVFSSQCSQDSSILLKGSIPEDQESSKVWWSSNPDTTEDFSVYRNASNWLHEMKHKIEEPRPEGPSHKRPLATAFSSQDWMMDYQPNHVEIKYAPTQVFNSNDSVSIQKVSPLPEDKSIAAATPMPLTLPSWLQGYYQRVAQTKPMQVAAADLRQETRAKESLPYVVPISVEGKGSQNNQQTTTKRMGSTTGRVSKIDKKAKEAKATTSLPTTMSSQVATTKKKYVEPKDTDVLLGRGGRSNNHPGNKRYREEVQKLKSWYRSSSKHEKTDLSDLLVESVRSNLNGRFLQRDAKNGKYFEVSKEVARKKASQALREENTPEARKAKRDKYSKKNSAARTA